VAIRLDRVVRGLAEEIKVAANGPQKAYRSERQVLSAATPSLRRGGKQLRRSRAEGHVLLRNVGTRGGVPEYDDI
jgi:hypothetical protein